MGSSRPIREYPEDILRDVYYRLHLIREFERARELLTDTGESPGHAHLSYGQEAVAVGSCLPLETADVIGSTHRGMGHILAKGSDPVAALAEFGGKETGLCDGRGGEMHMFDPENGVFGTCAMVGASAPHVAGAVLSAQLDGDDRIGVAFFGDGGANQGVVTETMNLAAIWDLPVIFLCENNQYQITTTRTESVAGERISDRAEGYGIPGTTIDGQDVLEVYETVSDAAERARNGGGPQFIECVTYRFDGHYSKEDVTLGDRTYRAEEEVAEWRENRDPIALFGERLTEADVFSDAELEEIETEATTTIEEALEYTREGDYPDGSRVLENVYADQAYPNVPQGGYR